MNFRFTNLVLAGLVMIAACVATATTANAQCCGTPTMAFAQPVVAVAQPVAFQEARVGLFDRWRMRRWGVTPVQPVMAAMPVQQTVAFAPSVQTMGYAPMVQPAFAAMPVQQTVGFAPAVQTVGWRPYVTAFAPLSTTTFVTAARPVVMTPVVAAASPCGCEPCGCSPCACAAAEPACPSCSSGVSQATYVEPAASNCPSCAASASVPSYSSIPSVGPATPQPQLAPNEGTPSTSQYDTNRLQIEEKPTDPAPATEPTTETDSSTYFEAPKLFNPQDRTASGPSVDVHNAVYRQPATYHSVSRATAPETDANGWYAVPSSR